MSEIVEVIIEANQDIKQSIISFLAENKIERAFICGAVGSVKNLLLVAPETMSIPPTLKKTYVVGPLEIVSFSGEAVDVSEMKDELKVMYPHLEGNCFLHLHASAALPGGNVVGGGVWEGKAFMYLKVCIAVIKRFA